MARSRSLRLQLLAGILIPIAVFIVVDTIALYRQALAAVNIAYDRTLLASAKAIGELLAVEGSEGSATIKAVIPYSALEAFEADNRSRMTYRVSDAKGAWIDGAQDLQAWRGALPQQGPYAALVDFYDDELRGDAVRVAVLLQPVASQHSRAMAMVQVAETLELRETLARRILLDTMQRQAILIAVIAAVVLLVVQRVTRPVRKLSEQMDARNEDDLTPISARDLPREIHPLTDATNQVMARLQHLLDHQKRFVRDAAHQLRTPLAVLKVQVQSARRGDQQAETALADIEITVDRATNLANQMLSLAKIEQLRQQGDYAVLDWAVIVRTLALEMSPLIADKDINFELETQPCTVLAHDWMLRELTRNLLHNAIHHTPPHGHLGVHLSATAGKADLLIADSGPGISDALRKRLFQPFATADNRTGTGLGLTIAHEIAVSLHGTIQMTHRVGKNNIEGLNVLVQVPLHQPEVNLNL
jgi:two-component system sensor histidine kinase TctE